MEDWWLKLVGPGFFIIPLADVKLNYFFSISLLSDLDIDRYFEGFLATGHDDAVWFQSLFPDGIKYDSYAFKLLLGQPEDGGRSLFYASMFASTGDECRSLLMRSCNMGYVHSYGYVYLHMGGDRSFLLKGAEKGDHACCYRLRNDSDGAIYVKKGARLGNQGCMVLYADQLPKSDRLYWVFTLLKMNNFHSVWNWWFGLSCDIIDTSLLFYIGEISKIACSWRMEEETFNFVMGKERVLINHTRVENAVREECVCWVMVARLLGVNKDVRKMISEMIWLSRFEGRE